MQARSRDRYKPVKPKPASRADIEGVRVDLLFDDIYRRAHHLAESKGVKLRLELIAWDPLFAAADPGGLMETLLFVAQQALMATEGGEVTLRAFPTTDDVCIMFEALYDCPQPQGEEAEAWEASLAPVRAFIQHMGGEMSTFRREEGGAGVCFWLPQWITEEISAPAPVKKAA